MSYEEEDTCMARGDTLELKRSLDSIAQSQEV